MRFEARIDSEFSLVRVYMCSERRGKVQSLGLSSFSPSIYLSLSLSLSSRARYSLALYTIVGRPLKRTYNTYIRISIFSCSRRVSPALARARACYSLFPLSLSLSVAGVGVCTIVRGAPFAPSAMRESLGLKGDEDRHEPAPNFCHLRSSIIHIAGVYISAR